ncbi:MAG: hypothetical protein LBD70_06730, partial [Bifidobacteriaceae bacterium]|nr:hypothetical protein [Bifidobacteriaceae bacterium]
MSAARRLADVRPTAREVIAQLAEGLKALGATRQPLRLAVFLGAAVPRHGLTMAGALAGGSRAWGERVAVIDGAGAVSYRELDRLAAGLAAGMVEGRLAGQGSRVALACRDDRSFLVAVAAAGRIRAKLTVLDPRHPEPPHGQTFDL